MLLGIRSIVEKNKYKCQKIEVVKNWPKPKLVYNIQVFLGFVNFYWQFIQGFRRIVAPLTLILKTIRSPDKPVASKNNDSRSASSKNDNIKPTSGKNNDNGENDGFGGNSVEYARISENPKKLAESGNLKGKKLSKFQKPAKSGKKSSKSENLPNFDVKDNGPSFLTPKARITFNYLWLAFTKALIL